MRERRLAFALLGIGLVAWYTLAYGQGRNDLWGRILQVTRDEAPQAGALKASGVVEADEVVLSPMRNARVSRVLVREGEQVTKGQPLLLLDRSLLDLELAVARRQCESAQMALAQVQAGATPGQIAVAEAELAQARVIEAAAEQRLKDLLLLREEQQELDFEIALAEAQQKVLELRLVQATASKDAAEVNKELLEYTEHLLANWSYPVRPPGLPMSLQIAPYQWWKAWANVNAMAATLEGHRERVAYLRELRRNPQELDAKVDAARATVAQAEASVDASEARLNGQRAGASHEQLALLDAQVQQAQSALEALLAQAPEFEVISPIDGMVRSIAAHHGEVALRGAATLVLDDLSQMTVTVFVPESRLGQVHVGQPAQITVDGWPGRVFTGQVTHVSDRAEYTPRNVATQEERALTYYAVEVAVTEEGASLKPGMPADVQFQ